MSSQLRSIGILGAAFGFGQLAKGVERGPETLRNFGIVSKLSSKTNNIVDAGDIQETNRYTPGRMYEKLYKKTLSLANQQHLNFILGGDHGIAIGSLCALIEYHANLSVIWVDAHGDMNTPQTSPSGNIHGMPLAALLGCFDTNIFGDMKWFTPRLRPEKLALIGVRDLDPGEHDLIQQLGIKVVSSKEVHSRGMNAVMSDVLKVIDPDSDSPLHLSFDIDSLDPIFAKATGIHVPNGLRIDHIVSLGHALAKTKRLVSCEIVEVNPDMVESEEDLFQTVDVVFQLLNALTSTKKEELTFPPKHQNSRLGYSPGPWPL